LFDGEASVLANFGGIFAILPTPFDESREIDNQSLRSLVEFEIKAGVNGITILGILGEVHRLSDEERQRVTELVVKQAGGRVPVVSGTGGPGTELAIKYSREAARLGIDGIMVAPPRLLKPNDEAVYSYYKNVASAVNIPIVIQDEPVTYGVHFSPSMIARLSEIEGIRYLKLEDAPTLAKISQIKKLTRERLGIFGGLGGLYAYEELSRGACGIMTGFAYPEMLVEIHREFQEGNRSKARVLFHQALPIIRYEAQPGVNLAIRKEILKRRGVIKTATLREPATKLDEEGARELGELINSLGLH
jgi:4-hydroxy-tetrahydrodipicolinate synthase